MDVANVNEPFAVTVRLSLALSCKTSPVLPASKPVTEPLIVKGPVPPEEPPKPELAPPILQPVTSVTIINKVA